MTVHEHDDEFADRNLLLHVALGIVSMSRRLDAVLPRLLAPRGVAPGDHSAAPHPGDAELVHFVLGLISFRARAMASLEAARDPRQAPRARREPEPAHDGELLR